VKALSFNPLYLLVYKNVLWGSIPDQSLCETCDGQSDIRAVFSPNTSDFPVRMFTPMLRIHSFIYHQRYIMPFVNSLTSISLHLCHCPTSALLRRWKVA